MSLFERPATSILHATDFSATSDHAFAHALAIALANEAELSILHVLKDAEDAVPWHEYPAVRDTLVKWGKLDPESGRKDVARELGIKVKKMVGVGEDVAKSIAELSEVKSFDLIVMATGEHQDHPFWSGGHTDVSLPVGKNTHLPILLVPEQARGAVSTEDGTTSLDQIVIAVDHVPNAQPALERITWALDKVGGNESEVTLLHVGDADNFPAVMPPTDGKFKWSKITRQGSAAREIVAAAEELDADLIVMVTDWKTGFWNIFQRSTVEQVVKNSPCLVFVMPTDE